MDKIAICMIFLAETDYYFQDNLQSQNCVCVCVS